MGLEAWPGHCPLFLCFLLLQGGINKKNLNGSIKRQPLELRRHLFFNYSRSSHCRFNTLFALLKPRPESDGKVVFGDGPHDPFPCIFEALLGQLEVSQRLLHLPEQKEVCRRSVRGIGGCGNTWIDLVANHFVGNSSSVDRHVVCFIFLRSNAPDRQWFRWP